MVVLRNLQGVCPECGAEESQYHIDGCAAFAEYMAQLNNPKLSEREMLRTKIREVAERGGGAEEVAEAVLRVVFPD